MKTDELTSAFLAIRSKLHRMAVRLLLNDEDAKDAMQDTFVKLWSKDKIQSDEEARNKLVRVLHNTCIDRLRANRSVPLESAPPDAAGIYETPVEDMAKYERLIITGLTDVQRQIYAMVTRDCLSYDEISDRMNMSVEAVRMNMSRARKKIRENIKAIDR